MGRAAALAGRVLESATEEAEPNPGERHQLWWKPGAHVRNGITLENEEGRGLVDEEGNVHTWPYGDAQHNAMAHAKGLDPAKCATFTINTDGRVNRAWSADYSNAHTRWSDASRDRVQRIVAPNYAGKLRPAPAGADPWRRGAAYAEVKTLNGLREAAGAAPDGVPFVPAKMRGFRAHIAGIRNRYADAAARLLASNGGNPEGVLAKRYCSGHYLDADHKQEPCGGHYAFVHRDTYQGDPKNPYRTSYYDAGGFSGHDVHPTAAAAVADLVRANYTEPAQDGARVMNKYLGLPEAARRLAAALLGEAVVDVDLDAAFARHATVASPKAFLEDRYARWLAGTRPWVAPDAGSEQEDAEGYLRVDARLRDDHLDRLNAAARRMGGSVVLTCSGHTQGERKGSASAYDGPAFHIAWGEWGSRSAPHVGKWRADKAEAVRAALSGEDTVTHSGFSSGRTATHDNGKWRKDDWFKNQVKGSVPEEKFPTTHAHVTVRSMLRYDGSNDADMHGWWDRSLDKLDALSRGPLAGRRAGRPKAEAAERKPKCTDCSHPAGSHSEPDEDGFTDCYHSGPADSRNPWRAGRLDKGCGCEKYSRPDKPLTTAVGRP